MIGELARPLASDASWLGDIPDGWKIKKFRYVFEESPEKIEAEVVGPMLSVSGYRGVEVKEYDDENRRRSDEDLVGYRIVRPGQLVVNTMWLNYAGLGVSEFEGHVSPAYRSYNIRAAVDRGYIHHLMRSSIYVQAYTRLLTGIRPNSLQMSREDLMDFPILLPPPSKQTAIAAFLNRETGKIDALVEEQRRLIELLKEKRQAVISQAVTKGLDPNAKMKPSGVEWLGEVPEHWAVVPLRWFASCKSGEGIAAELVQEEGTSEATVPVFGGNGVMGYAPTATVDHEVLAVGRVGALCGNVHHVVQPAWITDNALVLEATKGAFDLGYLALVLTTRNLNQLAARTAQPLITGRQVLDQRLPRPSLPEQASILDTVRKQTRQFDKLLDETERATKLLLERRAALISDAVTGKIDVREAAA